MQTVSANNQPTNPQDDASPTGAYGVIPLFQQIQASLRTTSLSTEWISINGLTSTEWIGSLTPTYISTTSFSYQGDQTTYFTVNRRVKALVNAGPIYGSIIGASLLNNVTTITILWDSTLLDNTVTDVQIGSLNPAHPSFPANIGTQGTVPLYVSVTNGGAGNAYTGNLVPAITAYTIGQSYVLNFQQANTGAVTVALNGLAATSVVRNGVGGAALALVTGDIVANQDVELVYTGTNFQLINASANLAVIADASPVILATAGSGTFIVPNTVTSLVVDIYGGGGGGGGGQSGGTGQGGGGGGGGAHTRIYLIGLAPGTSLNYTVGAAGSAGNGGTSNGSDGTPGGTSTFNGVPALGGAQGHGGGAGGGAAGNGGPAQGSGTSSIVLENIAGVAGTASSSSTGGLGGANFRAGGSGGTGSPLGLNGFAGLGGVIIIWM
ncbi:MAG: hypothetical protein KGJ90_01940 [Patescibacteria group bacterium]|nr:hypothetical protein [Patescibacteria group bacterium]